MEIRIRNVPQHLYLALLNRAECAGLSLGDYVLSELSRTTSTSSPAPRHPELTGLQAFDMQGSSAAVVRRLRGDI